MAWQKRPILTERKSTRRYAVTVGAGVPAKQAPRWLARASPVFAGTPAPTEQHMTHWFGEVL
ncbi:hypothetical protein E5221_13960 [Pseudomonas sp. A2]|nr:hypothetical protein E5221_13960 [Pseudomonas sp. A2]